MIFFLKVKGIIILTSLFHCSEDDFDIFTVYILSAEIESNLTQAFEFSDESNTESSAIKNELLFTDLLNFSQIPFELNIPPFSRF